MDNVGTVAQSFESRRGGKILKIQVPGNCGALCSVEQTGYIIGQDEFYLWSIKKCGTNTNIYKCLACHTLNKNDAWKEMPVTN